MSKTNIHEFKCSNRLGSDVCVKLLEQALSEAKQGNIRGLCITTVTADGDTEWFLGGTYSRAEIVGALETTKHSIIGD